MNYVKDYVNKFLNNRVELSILPIIMTNDNNCLPACSKVKVIVCENFFDFEILDKAISHVGLVECFFCREKNKELRPLSCGH